MPHISRPAIEITQGNLTVYLTYVTPNDLMIPDFFTVDKLDPTSGEGFQRVLDERRANRLATHLRDAVDHGYANLPTTIFLATDQRLDFDPKTSQLSYETDDVCPFSVVDGQHRIAGLIKSSQEEPRLSDFMLPAAIATSLDDAHQMFHFFIVNTTQKPVEAGLAQQITRRFTNMRGIESLPYLPHWVRQDVAQGGDAQALELVEFLNKEDTSPLKGRVRMANDTTPPRGRINQSSLVTMLKSQVFAGNNPIFVQETDPTRRHRIINNYFNAVDNVFVGDVGRDASLVYGNNGIYFCLMISKWVFSTIYASTRDFTKESIEKVLRDALLHLDDLFVGISDPEWWRRGNEATQVLNRAGATTYANGFLQALQAAQELEVKI